MFATACLLLLVMLGQAQDERGKVRASFRDSIGNLARAKTLVQLEILWRHSTKDYPHRAIHAAMYLKLNGSNSDAMLIRAMPINGKEMRTFYYAQDTKRGQDMAVTEAYTAYYTHLADALGRDPRNLPQFLKMIHAFDVVDNVDEWPWLCRLASNIYDAHPKAYVDAANQLEPKFKQQALDCEQAPEAP